MFGASNIRTPYIGRRATVSVNATGFSFAQIFSSALLAALSLEKEDRVTHFASVYFHLVAELKL